MANRVILGVLGVLLVGGGAAAYVLAGADGALDTPGRQLYARFVEMRAEQPEAEALRAFLKDLEQHPEKESDPGLRRARAWALHRIGNSRRAWDCLEENLVDPSVDDLWLGAQILQTRHAETGDEELAAQARSCADQHYQTAGSVDSLFTAWQMAVRTDDAQAAAGYAELAQSAHADSVQARTIAAVGRYPIEVDDSPAAAAAFDALIDEYEVPPAELQLALAWSEISRREDLLQGHQRAEAVLRSFRVSKTARTIIAVSALGLEQYSKSVTHLEWLVRTYPQHPKARVWTALLGNARDEAAKAAGK